MTWLHSCKFFWWFHYADTKDVVFVWFHTLTCLNCVSVLIILEFFLIICLELKFLILFLLLLLLVRACRKNLQIHHFQTSHHIFMPQETIFQVYICAPFFFFLHLINHSIQQNMFVASHYIILKLYHIHLFFFPFLFFVFVFLAC